MGAWQIVHSVLAVVGGCVFAMVGVACVWPMNQPRRDRPATRRCRLRTVEWPEAWTCGPPEQPFTLADAHVAMQLHREHDCERKHAAFDTLVAAGRINPDSTRRHRLWGKPW
ncbi:hypothetical protein [Nocardia sp. CA-120079]|uniref:hypothetical protein n=1 Tax=Nocardia sp. CA-120079 TaxID=3239974 RepID=UPI003D99943F